MNRPYPSSVVVNYQTKGKAQGLTAASGKQLAIFNLRAFNNSGGTATVGILRSLSLTQSALSTIVGGVGPTQQSTAFASALNVFSTTNNDGFVLEHKNKFGLVGLTVSTAGAAGVYTYQYWNGSAFVTLTTVEVPVYSATGDIWIVFVPPVDWATGGGVGTGTYAIKVLATTAPGTAVAVNALWVSEFLDIYSGVANNAAVQLTFPDTKPFLLSASEGVMPYFSVPNAANLFGAYYNNI